MSIPMKARDIADRYFLEHRAKVLDLAAFLDRYDRAAQAEGHAATDRIDDGRVRALLAAIHLLIDRKPERARRVLELWSDRSTDPIDRAPMKGAIGVAPLPDE
ncbi:MAG: hypothetical protein EBR10_05865 [Planctomycetes bacterium]|nr:hypothetical protein [Planctomycetota bacterium]